MRPLTPEQRNRIRTSAFLTGRKMSANSVVLQPADFAWPGGARALAAIRDMNPPMVNPQSMQDQAAALRTASRELARAADVLEIAVTGRVQETAA